MAGFWKGVSGLLAVVALFALSAHAADARTLRVPTAPHATPADLSSLKSAFLNQANRMRFVSAGSGSGPKIEPAPGQTETKPVTVRPQDDFMSDVKMTTRFLGDHTFKADTKGLLKEIDASENQKKDLEVKMVEKKNFVASLEKRLNMLKDDISKDEQAVSGLDSHIKALTARLERTKKSQQLQDLRAQFNEYDSASSKLTSQADELKRVKEALQLKMTSLTAEVANHAEEEEAEMRKSISPSASGDEGGSGSEKGDSEDADGSESEEDSGSEDGSDSGNEDGSGSGSGSGSA